MNLPGSQTYSPLTIALHWLLALAIPMVFGLGLYMADLPLSPDKLRYYSWHKWAGVTIFLLTALRLTWRLTQHKLPAPIQMLAWQQAVAAWVHRVLYLLMFAIPLSGWLMSSAKGVSTMYFGLWLLPDLIGRNAKLGEQLLMLHIGLNYVMAGIVAVHGGAALKHHFVDGDEVLVRMMPFLKMRGSRRTR